MIQHVSHSRVNDLQHLYLVEKQNRGTCSLVCSWNWFTLCYCTVLFCVSGGGAKTPSSRYSANKVRTVLSYYRIRIQNDILKMSLLHFQSYSNKYTPTSYAPKSWWRVRVVLWFCCGAREFSRRCCVLCHQDSLQSTVQPLFDSRKLQTSDTDILSLLSTR